MVNHMDQWLHVGPQKLPEGDGWGGGAVKRAVLCLFFVQAGGASPSRPGDWGWEDTPCTRLSTGIWGDFWGRQTWQWELQWFV